MRRIGIILALWILPALVGRGTSVEFPITPKSLDQRDFLFSVSSNSTNRGVFFQVTATAKTNVVPVDASAGLSLVTSDAGGRSMGPVTPEPPIVLQKDERVWKATFIASTELLKNPGVCFVFGVPAHAMINGKSQAMPSIDFYVLKLRDFLPEQDSVHTGTALGIMQERLAKIGQKLPELALTSTNSGKPSSAQVWQGDEFASARFFLRDHPRYAPASPPSQPSSAPLSDLEVVITHYVSSNNAQQAVEQSLRHRPAASPPRESYKGMWLYRYTCGGGVVICQSGPYVIEVCPFSEAATPLAMKVLDIVSDGLGEAKR
jgi:hypothetical protein